MPLDEGLIGRQLQQYLITALLGSGGMGVVYRARDVRLEREIALKILPPGALTDDARRHRFMREARTASTLTHPNIVTVYEVDSDGGLDFIAMELVNGKPLSSCIPPNGLPLETAASYTAQMLEGMAAAHRAGLVHRDLKPGNLMVRDDGVLKVLDFGLAKRYSTGEGATETMVTTEGHVVGTLAYMSPEQARGDDLGPRSDVFVIGLIVYQMLTGVRPFRGPGLEVAHAIIEGRFDPVRQLRPECPPAFERIIAKAMAPDPRRRYADAGEMLADARAEGLTPVTMSGTISVTLMAAAMAALPRPWYRRRPVQGVAIAVIIAAAVWLAYPRMSGLLQRTPQTATVMEIEGASPGELVRRATELLRLHYREGYTDRAIQQLAAALGQKQNFPVADARLSLAYWRKNALNPDPHWLQQAAVHADRAVQGDPQLAAAHLAKGASLAATGELDKAAASYESALTLDPSNAELYWRLGDLAVARKDSAAAEQHYLRAVSKGPSDWEAHGKLGGFYYRQGRYEDALREYEKMKALAPDHARSYSNLAAVYHQLNRTDEAATALQRSLEIAPDAQTYSNLGTLLFFQGRYPEAAQAFERAVQSGANGYRHWGNFADAVRQIPESKSKATEAYTRAIQLARERLTTHPDDADARSSMALYLARNGEVQPALAEIARSMEQAKLPPAVLFKLAVTAEVSGRRAQALDLLQRSLAAKYPFREILLEPDLVQLRADPEYHKIAAQYQK